MAQKRRSPVVTTPHDLVRIDALTPDPANRRRHSARNLEMVADALRQVGAARSIVIDEDDVILAGNGVTEAAATVGITQVRIVEADGEEIIAVRRRGLTPEQKRALAIFDNRTAELAEWNFEQLAADRAAGLTLAPFWTPEELTAIVSPGVKGGRTDPDDVPPERATDILAGDLFALGAHRLLCGDATSAADVARVSGDVVPFLMVTDPPYGVDYDPDWRNRARRASGETIGGRRVGTVTNDDRVDWTPAWQCFHGAIAYVWHASLFTNLVAESLVAAGLTLRSQLIWPKARFVIGRGHYHWQHEACFYAYREGQSAKWQGGHSQSTLWAITAKDDTGDTNHSAQKPVECMRRPIENHGDADDAVYEPFAGSGTTLIAAEQVSRPCYAVEISPTYCQMAIDRWEAFTGHTARKVGEAIRT